VESDGKNRVKSVFAGLERLSPPDLLDLVAVNAVAAVLNGSAYFLPRSVRKSAARQIVGF
jgi:hypothetical protein